jgi:hypothetical protein
MAKNEEIVEEEVLELEEVKEVKESWIKRHGKKLAVGAGLAALGIAGFVLGRKTNESVESYDENDFVYEETSESEE